MTSVRRLEADEGAARAADLAAVLLDCVAGGASVSFMAELTEAEAEAFFREAAGAVAARRRALFAAFDGERIVGTVQLVTALPPNQPHRGEISKLLVHRSARGQGLGRALMLAAEAEAMRLGKTLLCLDTASGAAAKIYAGLGYVKAGVIPGYALFPDGAPCDTELFWKRLDGRAPRSPQGCPAR